MVPGRRPTMLGQYAGFVTRAIALIIDIAIVSMAVVVINWVISLPLTYFFSLNVSTCLASPGEHYTLVLFFCRIIQWGWFLSMVMTAPLYFATLTALNGQTIGKYIMGVRVVRMDGRRMTFWGSLLRWFGYFLSALPVGLGFFMALVDDQRRALHDRLAGTGVIYAWRARRNEALVDRVERWFEPDEEMKAIAERPTLKLSSIYELVVIALPSYRQLQSMLAALENSVISGDIAVVHTAVMVKDGDGLLGTVSVSNLTVGENALFLVDTDLNIPKAQLDQIQADAPGDAFLIVLLLKDEWLDATLDIAARRSPIMLTHYDVGDHPDALTASQGAHPDLVAVDPWADHPASLSQSATNV